MLFQLAGEEICRWGLDMYDISQLGGREGGAGLLVQMPPEMESPTAPPTEYPVARRAVTEATSIIELECQFRISRPGVGWITDLCV